MSDLDAHLRTLVDAAALPVTPEEVTGRGGAVDAGRHRRRRRVPTVPGGPDRPGGVPRRGRRRRQRASWSRPPVRSAPRPGGSRTRGAPVAARLRQLTASLSDADTTWRPAIRARSPRSAAVDRRRASCPPTTAWAACRRSPARPTRPHHAGHTWSASTLPAGVATATPVSCVSATWCSAGWRAPRPKSGDPLAKKELRDPVLPTTTDAGATWQLHKVPIPPAVEYLPAYQQFPAETTFWPGVLDTVRMGLGNVCNVVGHVLDDMSGRGASPPIGWSSCGPPTAGSRGRGPCSRAGGRVGDGGRQRGFGHRGSAGVPVGDPLRGARRPVGLDPNNGVVDSPDLGRRRPDVARVTESRGHTSSIPASRAPPRRCAGAVRRKGRSCDRWTAGSHWELVPAPPDGSYGSDHADHTGRTTPAGSGTTWQSISCSTARSCVLGGDGMVANRRRRCHVGDDHPPGGGGRGAVRVVRGRGLLRGPGRPGEQLRVGRRLAGPDQRSRSRRDAPGRPSRGDRSYAAVA